MLYLVRSRGLCTLQEQCSGQEKSWLSCISVSFITNTLPQASVNYFLLCAFLILHIWFLPDSPWNMYQPISPDPPFSVHEFFYGCISILTWVTLSNPYYFIHPLWNFWHFLSGSLNGIRIPIWWLARITIFDTNLIRVDFNLETSSSQEHNVHKIKKGIREAAVLSLWLQPLPLITQRIWYTTPMSFSHLSILLPT
jgi:hypothetical protein